MIDYNKNLRRVEYKKNWKTTVIENWNAKINWIYRACNSVYNASFFKCIWKHSLTNQPNKSQPAWPGTCRMWVDQAARKRCSPASGRLSFQTGPNSLGNPGHGSCCTGSGPQAGAGWARTARTFSSQGAFVSRIGSGSGAPDPGSGEEPSAKSLPLFNGMEWSVLWWWSWNI